MNLSPFKTTYNIHTLQTIHKQTNTHRTPHTTYKHTHTDIQTHTQRHTYTPHTTYRHKHTDTQIHHTTHHTHTWLTKLLLTKMKLRERWSLSLAMSFNSNRKMNEAICLFFYYETIFVTFLGKKKF